MEITMTEMLLFAWAVFATGMWFDTKNDLRVHRLMTGEVFKRIADGRIKVVDKEDSFDLVEVKK